jgi:hypothetical protein
VVVFSPMFEVQKTLVAGRVEYEKASA